MCCTYVNQHDIINNFIMHCHLLKILFYIEKNITLEAGALDQIQGLRFTTCENMSKLLNFSVHLYLQF